MQLVNRMLLIVAVGFALGFGQSMRHHYLFKDQPIRTEVAPGGGGGGVVVAAPAGVEPDVARGGGGPGVVPVAPGALAAPAAALGLDITIPQAFSLYQQGGIMFLDARRKDEFEAGHVDGALLLSTEHFGRGGVPATVGVLDKTQPVVVYCGGGACDASKNLVIMLQNFGFTRFHIMTDGFPAWQQAGHPVASGPSPIDPEEGM